MIFNFWQGKWHFSHCILSLILICHNYFLLQSYVLIPFYVRWGEWFMKLWKIDIEMSDDIVLDIVVASKNLLDFQFCLVVNVIWAANPLINSQCSNMVSLLSQSHWTLTRIRTDDDSKLVTLHYWTVHANMRNCSNVYSYIIYCTSRLPFIYIYIFTCCGLFQGMESFYCQNRLNAFKGKH